jgi:hypothetical protein
MKKGYPETRSEKIMPDAGNPHDLRGIGSGQQHLITICTSWLILLVYKKSPLPVNRKQAAAGSRIAECGHFFALCIRPFCPTPNPFLSLCGKNNQ